jgi:site-specific DNA-methyltransferase (adenine-specific)
MKLYCGDCLEIMKELPDKSINLIVVDPPYNIGKAEWDKIDNYIEWCGKWIIECQRVLKDNGSFYFFHNDMQQIADLMLWIRNNSRFIFKQFIVWNKRFDGVANKGYLDGFIVPDGLRNYQQMAEYILFYTFQDETGLMGILPLCFEKYLDYMTEQKELSGMSINKINQLTGYAAIASHWFWQPKRVQPQPRLIQEYDYKKLQSTGYFQREYEDLKLEYESLRLEYEGMRYTFNNQKTHHSVWNYEIAERCDHITPKPVSLIENIIRHSSNEGDIVLDCFMGSGTTGIACNNLNRDFIGIEKDKGYFGIAEKRINEVTQQEKLL